MPAIIRKKAPSKYFINIAAVALAAIFFIDLANITIIEANTPQLTLNLMMATLFLTTFLSCRWVISFLLKNVKWIFS